MGFQLLRLNTAQKMEILSSSSHNLLHITLVMKNVEAKDVEKLNAFADCYYENKVEVTSASKHNIGDAPDCGMIFVWPNEFASLDKVNRTYATKVVTLVHKRNEADFVSLGSSQQQVN